MSSNEIYQRIHNESISYIRKNDILVDRYLEPDCVDTRKGISLIVKLREENRKTYEELVENIRHIEPEQYYYPFEDLHITIFDFVSAKEKFISGNHDEEKIIKCTADVIAGSVPFTVAFRGIVCSREAVIINGYDENEVVRIRNKIRQKALECGIKNEERYVSYSAHSTFMRFRKKLRDGKKFEKEIGIWREYEFWKEEIDTIDLVEHDWYNRSGTKRIIEEYRIDRR